MAVLFFCAAGAAAIPIKTYRQRLHDAQVGLTAQMFNDNENPAARSAQFTGTLRSIRESLPPNLTVEWSGGSSLPVNNHWLEVELEELEKTEPGDRERNYWIATINERLAALDAQLADFEQAEAANAQSRDEAKARLAEILRRKEFEQKAAEEPAINRLLNRIWNWLAYWLDRLFGHSKPLSSGPSALVGLIVRILVIGLGIFLIGFVIWKLAPRVIRGRGRKKAAKREARVVLGETLEADQSAADLWDEAEALARGGNIRAAIRKGYIALLCELGDRKVVGLAQHKTNRDYLRDVYERRALYLDMNRLTNSFENHWYGFVPATDEDWNTFRAGYKQALTHG